MWSLKLSSWKHWLSCIRGCLSWQTVCRDLCMLNEELSTATARRLKVYRPEGQAVLQWCFFFYLFFSWVETSTTRLSCKQTLWRHYILKTNEHLCNFGSNAWSSVIAPSETTARKHFILQWEVTVQERPQLESGICCSVESSAVAQLLLLLSCDSHVMNWFSCDFFLCATIVLTKESL